MSLSKELLSKVESLHNMLSSSATGGERYEEEYKKLRLELINEPIISTKLPRFVHTCRDHNQWWAFIKGKFPTYAERRNYLREQFEEVLSLLEKGHHTPSTTSMELILKNVNSSSVLDAWKSAFQRCTSDPEGAITSSRTLIESVCKHILDEFGTTYSEKDDLPKLYKLAADQLNLSPSQHTEQIFKQILGGCQTVVEGLGALRNKHGDAHGKGANYNKPSSRHAELSVNLAGTMTAFLISSFEEKKPKTI